jgi:proton-dependent oligopeptide transporter, POT family
VNKQISYANIRYSVYLFGTSVLFFTSLPSVLHKDGGLGGLLTTMILIGIGIGGVKVCLTPLIGVWLAPING